MSQRAPIHIKQFDPVNTKANAKHFIIGERCTFKTTLSVNLQSQLSSKTTNDIDKVTIFDESTYLKSENTTIVTRELTKDWKTEDAQEYKHFDYIYLLSRHRPSILKLHEQFVGDCIPYDIFKEIYKFVILNNFNGNCIVIDNTNIRPNQKPEDFIFWYHENQN
jgi:hypothetical protein